MKKLAMGILTALFVVLMAAAPAQADGRDGWGHGGGDRGHDGWGHGGWDRGHGWGYGHVSVYAGYPAYRPVYVYPAPVVVADPYYQAEQPVYVAPAPVYVTPAPVYVAPAPVVVVGRPYYHRGFAFRFGW